MRLDIPQIGGRQDTSRLAGKTSPYTEDYMPRDDFLVLLSIIPFSLEGKFSSRTCYSHHLEGHPSIGLSNFQGINVCTLHCIFL